MNSSKRKKRWWISTYLLAMGLLLYLILTLGFGSRPLFVRHAGTAARGVVPEVSFAPSPYLWLMIFASVIFLALAFQVLRLWAMYYLSRKMLLSYLFFAFIPLLTSLLIFVTITKVMLGISSLLTFEDAMDRKAQEIMTYGYELQRDIVALGSGINSAETQRLILTKPSPDDNLIVRAFHLTEKSIGVDRLMIPLELGAMPMVEHSPDYEATWPSWMQERMWRGIVNIDGDLFIRFFLYDDNTLIVASLPIDGRFLQALPGFQVVQVTVASHDGTTHISTINPNVPWWRKLPVLAPFSSRWDSGAFNWQSGYFEEYGHITFGLELSTMGSVLENTGILHFFYSGQKLSSVKMIIGTILVVLLCVLVALVFGGYLVSYITRSLNLLAKGHEQIAQGRLVFRMPFIGRDQLGAMGTSFNDMVSSINDLMGEVAEKEKYHQELRIARDIQMSLLPDIKKLTWASNIAAECIPARDVGGDYYELVRTKSGDIGIFIADVSGKGTSAAFYMAELKGVLIALRHQWHDPHQLMLSLNEIMGTTLSSNVFISAAYLLIDPVSKTGQLARAGHCPAYHLKENGVVDELSPPGMAIGIAPNNIFGKILETETFAIADADKIMLYTDGLDEMTRDHELYGQDRLRDVLEKNTEKSVEELKRVILDDVLGFLSTGTQNDDLTLVVAGLPSQVREPVSAP